MLFDPKWTSPTTEIKLEPWQEILLKAADLLEEYGWIRGRYGTIEGGLCTVGAIWTATNMLNYKTQDVREASSHLSKIISHSWASTPKWNDAPGRTKEEVVATLRKAAHVV